MPATLRDLGLITNPAEAEMLATNPGLYAQGVYNGILSFFGML